VVVMMVGSLVGWIKPRLVLFSCLEYPVIDPFSEGFLYFVGFRGFRG